MVKKNKRILVGVIVFGLLLMAVVFCYRNDNIKGALLGSTGTIEGTANYYADATHDEVITTNPAVLHRILIGTTTGGQIQISDHEANAVSNIVSFTTGTDLQGVWDIGIYFSDGIVFTTTAQDKVTFIWSPR